MITARSVISQYQLHVYHSILIASATIREGELEKEEDREQAHQKEEEERSMELVLIQ